MKAYTTWNHTPYARIFEQEKRTLPYVCGIAPFEGGFRFEWFDLGSNGAHKALVHKLESYDAPLEYELTSRIFEITGLERDVTYELTVCRADGSAHSDTRLIRTGRSLGTVINYLHPQDSAYAHSGSYLGTPMIVKLPSGKLIVSMDFHGSGTDGEHLTMLFQSLDGGKSWHYLTELSPCFWARLFVHGGKLYCMGVSSSYGDLLIGCSCDEGKTWSLPTCLVRGIARAFGCHQNGGPVLHHNGKIYTALEYGNNRFFKFYHSLIWANEDADLLDPASWTYTAPAEVNKNAPDMPVAQYVTAMEGNPVALPDGTVGSLMRLDPINCPFPDANKAMLLRMNEADPEGKLVLDRVVRMPCGLRNKFIVKFDPATKKYLALCNEYLEDYTKGRAILTFCASDDCINWRVLHRIIDAREDIKTLNRRACLAYSYPCFEFDGNDLLVVLRTAANGAKNGHDTNMITFLRIENYQQYV